MNNLIALNELVRNRQLALAVYKDIPDSSMYINMNQGFAQFYIYHGEEKQGGKPKSLVYRYSRVADDWASLDCTEQANWGQRFLESDVFSVFDFQLALARQYPIDVLGVSKAWEVVNKQPVDATHYNCVSDHYHRLGQSEYSEMYIPQRHTGYWCETAHRNDDFAEMFIDLESLLIKLQAWSIYLNNQI